jgi:group I intron endonuclease
MAVGIYKITSPNGKIYVGQSVDIEKRWSRHYRYLGNSSQDRQPVLRNSMKKYGFKNHIFAMIEECNIEDLNKKERYWQILLKPELNCRVQGLDDKSGYLSDKVKKKISQSRKGHVAWNKGTKTGKPSGSSKLIVNEETGIFYTSIQKAANSIGMNRTTLNAMLTGQNSNRTSFRYV